ncbi:Salicylic acid-binding protein 2 [Glycine soja]
MVECKVTTTTLRRNHIMGSENCIDKKHFVLVHGACHGAWCWYKLKPRLESAGHKVTVLDLAASGANMKKIEDVDTFSQYTEPLLFLLDTIPSNEKVVLVGHSFGGLNIALAMEKFPEKVAVGVFLTAFAPDVEHHPSYVLEKYNERTPSSAWLDTEFAPSGNKTSMFFGPNFLSNKLYQLSPIEDLELAKTLVRPSSLFVEDLSTQKNFSKEGYGSVPRAYIVCTEDIAIPMEYQLWMIQNAGINDLQNMHKFTTNVAVYFYLYVVFEFDLKHYVLVHGACHGAWCWYKLKPRLESEGHKVTVLNHAASGINMKKIEDVDTFSEYTEPLLQLLDTIPSNEKVVLVGHSLGGMSIAIAMEKFPEKVAVGVFLAAFAPDVEHRPSYVLEKYNERTPSEEWLDTEFCQCGNKTLIFFGPKFLSYKLYQLCPIEDLELAMTLARPSSYFIEDLSKEKNFSKQRYGSVPRVYIVCPEDLGIPLNYQHWMIQNAGFNDVVEINGADHMPIDDIYSCKHEAYMKLYSGYVGILLNLYIYFDLYIERIPPSEWFDTEFAPSGNKTSILLGPEILAKKLYQLSPIEDLELAKTLVRPSSLFVEDLSQQKNFSKERYGSVPRAYIVCTEDLTIPIEYQLWMIQNAGINDVLKIKGADHMAMNSRPRELFESLQKIAAKYA